MFGFPRLRALVAEQGRKRSLGNFLLEKLYSYQVRLNRLASHATFGHQW
jgi:hypothetical protein